ncbi:hypothetical protein PFICI_13151 [Pestalotiopsis fici W106-1]|uniref:Uncharacterized protein n=1 Tax=Pestalotiopsis fici (strain W106-1 / CGMCC3.15140) TaxID=1229662 RepID=W3WND8_PESFW|nr:uncharacterized protein PFICI_13151 [Pestalotiopsis fici W106-1]ETS74667.1 hypothetical protein PFICI_13151 [Pestalotiopsis fici W106-1]
MPDPEAIDQCLRRGLEHEDEDYERTVQKLVDQDLDDWPNEAGFEGLNEVRGPVDLHVKGSIPSWAAGSLFRTGPGQYNVEDTPLGTYRTKHWFDGFGHSHKFQIIPNQLDPNGPVRVEYSSKRQTEELVAEIKSTGRRSTITFGQRQDVCVGIFSKVMSVWRASGLPLPTNIENIAVTVQGSVPGLPLPNTKQPLESGHRSTPKVLWLGTDNSILKAFDTNTMEALDCKAHTTLNPLLKGPLSCAHAQRDPETGDYFNYNLQFGPVSTYRVFRSNAATGTTDILATIAQPDVRPAYIHSFFLTRSYVILCVPSTHIRAMGLSIPWNRSITDAIDEFDEKNLCKWFVIDRREDKGVVAQFETPAGFYFHSANAYDELDGLTGEINIFCDMLEYPNTDVIKSYEIDVLMGKNGMGKNFWGDESRARNSQVRLARYKFSIPKNHQSSGGSTKYLGAQKMFEIKAPHIGELPTINPSFATKDYRYVYSLPNRGRSTLLDSISKTNVKTRETIYWDNPKGHTPGEAIFVPRPRIEGDKEEPAEDDGVLLSIVLDGHGKTSYLVCLDARTMKEIGRAECEWAIGFGFHGMHVPA